MTSRRAALTLLLAVAPLSGCGRAPEPAPSEVPPVTQTPEPAPVPTPTPEPARMPSPSPGHAAKPPPKPTPTPPPTPTRPKTAAEVGAELDHELRTGVTALRARRFPEAVEHLRLAHRLEPADASILTFLRQAERAQLEATATPEELAGRVSKDERDLAGGLEKFQAALAAKDPDRAGGILAELRDRFPDEPKLSAARPALEELRRARADAIVYERRAAAWRSEVAHAQALEAADPAGALAAYRAALGLFPNDPYAAKKVQDLEAKLAALKPTPAPTPAPAPAATPAPTPTPRPSPAASRKAPTKKPKPPR